jgi:hypothetical protein
MQEECGWKNATWPLERNGQALVVHACNPSYLGGWHREDQGLRPDWAYCSWDPHLQNNQRKMDWRYAQGVVYCFASTKPWVQTLIPPTKQKEGRREGGKERRKEGRRKTAMEPGIGSHQNLEFLLSALCPSLLLREVLWSTEWSSVLHFCVFMQTRFLCFLIHMAKYDHSIDPGRTIILLRESTAKVDRSNVVHYTQSLL